jgi:N-acyl-D-aspartate/D-glutamate deacylase
MSGGSSWQSGTLGQAANSLRRYGSPGGRRALDRDSRDSFATYTDDFPPTAVNTIMHVSHNTLHLMTTGMEERAPTDNEMATMTRLLDEGLAVGEFTQAQIGFILAVPLTPDGLFGDRGRAYTLGIYVERTLNLTLE